VQAVAAAYPEVELPGKCHTDTTVRMEVQSRMAIANGLLSGCTYNFMGAKITAETIQRAKERCCRTARRVLETCEPMIEVCREKRWGADRVWFENKVAMARRVLEECGEAVDEEISITWNW
jgi:hypothetical protein